LLTRLLWQRGADVKVKQWKFSDQSRAQPGVDVVGACGTLIVLYCVRRLAPSSTWVVSAAIDCLGGRKGEAGQALSGWYEMEYTFC